MANMGGKAFIDGARKTSFRRKRLGSSLCFVKTWRKIMRRFYVLRESLTPFFNECLEDFCR